MKSQGFQRRKAYLGWNGHDYIIEYLLPSAQHQLENLYNASSDSTISPT